MRTKSILLLSLLLNVGLAGGGWYALRSSREPSVHSSPAQARTNSPAAATDSVTEPGPQRVPESAPNPASQPGQWSRLKSGDDATYVRNLRLAGAPESTVRDILNAEIGHRYDQQREVLQAHYAKGEIGAVDLQAGLAKLWQEQNALAGQLFASPSNVGSSNAAVSSPARTSNGRVAAIARFGDPAPLALLDPNPAWGLTEDQVAMWQNVGDKFVTAIGGPGQNPADPAYKQRWQMSQEEANEQLQAIIGWEAFSKLNIWAQSQMPTGTAP